VEYAGKKYFTDKCREIHRLIRSLTKGQHIGLHPQLPPKRQKLYDLYRKMEDYDPAVIRAAFPDDTAPSLNLNKNVLLDEVIRYRYDFTPHNGRRDLANLIGEADDLRSDGFEAFAIYRIDAAIRLAIKLESMSDLYTAVKVRQKLVDLSQDVRVVRRELAALEAKAIAGMQETIEIDHIYYLYQLGLQSENEKAKELDTLFDRLSSTSIPKLYRNRIQYHNVRQFLFQQKRNTVGAMEEALGIIQAAEAKPSLLADTDLREVYFMSVTFLSVCHAENRDFLKSDFYMEKLKVLSNTWGGGLGANPGLHARYLYSSLTSRIAIKDWSAAHELSKVVFKEFVQRDVLTNRPIRISLLSLAAYSAFLQKDYQLTRKLLIDMRHSITPSTILSSFSMIAWAGVVQLLSFVDEGNTHLRVVAKEVIAWMKSFGPLGEYELAMIRFYDEVSEDPECHASESSLLNLRGVLVSLFSQPEYAIQAAMFPMIQWIDARLTGQDLRQLNLD
jgi:hypothetical protein